MQASELRELSLRVQRNCDIADARHAGNDTLCIYLLKMREFYRWMRRLPYSAPLDREEVGDWVIRQERLWEDLEDKDLEPLTLGKTRFDPFDHESVNRRLDPHGLVYGAGYGRGARPLFFLGSVVSREEFDGYRIYVVGEEQARDLVAPPAMSRGEVIFVRTESVRRMLHEMIEAWQFRGSPPGDAMARALAAYGCVSDNDAGFDAMVDSEVESAVWHEVGEVLAGRLLGAAWQERTLEVAGTRGERVMRAVRDHLADSLTTLPALLDSDHDGALHFYFANLTGMRAVLAPRLRKAYEAWTGTGSRHALKRLVAPSREHWLSVARLLLETPPESWPISDEALPALRLSGP
ncbi:hypothetical protein B1C78_14885 [Thioalkalivibrio denitrificans]|uniref:Uncharacterized protein n=1 Tax=Thioalkalivibrio denitrificans TaxID=108003 RepID=A0A1V3NBL5_9GAMM|nr:Sfum_1244 family protein [Thioalkalivibrio denitrificans]OOG22477.1 hypothetical protein B1C78_14885 [Thioalkalivibrio denitrificans]